MCFLGGPQSRAGAWRAMATMAGSWALPGFGMFSVIERSLDWSNRTVDAGGMAGHRSRLGVDMQRARQRLCAASGDCHQRLGSRKTRLVRSDSLHRSDQRGSIAFATRLRFERLRTEKVPPPLGTIQVEIYGQSHEPWMQRPRSSLVHSRNSE